MVIGGKGVKTLGVIPKAARLVDTAPTIAALLGCTSAPVAGSDNGNGSGDQAPVRQPVQDGEQLLDSTCSTRRSDRAT